MEIRSVERRDSKPCVGRPAGSGRAAMVRIQTTFIPQSLHRGGLVMTTGGHPPPEIKRRSLSCSAGRR
nr:MAG TPA: hypothetical protein [Caudoviricetes sp.]